MISGGWGDSFILCHKPVRSHDTIAKDGNSERKIQSAADMTLPWGEALQPAIFSHWQIDGGRRTAGEMPEKKRGNISLETAPTTEMGFLTAAPPSIITLLIWLQRLTCQQKEPDRRCINILVIHKNWK